MKNPNVCNKRIDYIDNLRSITILLLIPYHLAMAYNSWGEANYIFFERINPIASIVTFISPWFMPLMFLLAGVSASFSIKKRGYFAFIKERLKRLGIPLIAGILFINPILSFVADKSHNGYEGSFLEHYSVFFSKFTDLTGYDGGFTLGHFWFIAVLILISCLCCGIIKLIDIINSKNVRTVIIAVIALLAIALFDVELLGKKLPVYLCVYLLGYYLFSREEAVELLVKFKWIFIGVWIAASVTNTILFVYIEKYELHNTVCNYLSFAFGVPATFCLGHDYLDFSNKLSKFVSRTFYSFYCVHFPIVVLCQYILNTTEMNCIINFAVSLFISYFLTFAATFVFDKCKLFLKTKRKKSALSR